MPRTRTLQIRAEHICMSSYGKVHTNLSIMLQRVFSKRGKPYHLYIFMEHLVRTFRCYGSGNKTKSALVSPHRLPDRGSEVCRCACRPFLFLSSRISFFVALILTKPRTSARSQEPARSTDIANRRNATFMTAAKGPIC